MKSNQRQTLDFKGMITYLTVKCTMQIMAIKLY